MTTPRARSAKLAGCLICTGLAGCGVGPSYHRPKLDVPLAYTSPAQPPAPPPSTAWWHGFNAPDLDRLIAEARIGSPDVAAAAARIVQADQAARVAGSPLLPGITGTAGQTWQRTGTGSEATGSSAALLTGLQGGHRYTETRLYSAELNASYEVDFWGENLDAYRAATALARGSRYDAQTVWLTTISSIASTYFQALGYRDRLRIAQHNLESAASILDAFRARLTVGTADALDVSQQEALVAGYRATLPSLESQFRQEVIALAILVGEAPEHISLGEVHLTDLTLPPVAPGLPSFILRRRPDVAYAEAQLVSQNQTVRQDYAAFFPSLTLTASGGLSSLALVHDHRPGHGGGQPGQPADADDLRQWAEIGHAGRGEGALCRVGRRLRESGAAGAERCRDGAHRDQFRRQPGEPGGRSGAHRPAIGHHRTRAIAGRHGRYRDRAEHGDDAVQ